MNLVRRLCRNQKGRGVRRRRRPGRRAPVPHCAERSRRNGCPGRRLQAPPPGRGGRGWACAPSRRGPRRSAPSLPAAHDRTAPRTRVASRANLADVGVGIDRRCARGRRGSSLRNPPVTVRPARSPPRADTHRCATPPGEAWPSSIRWCRPEHHYRIGQVGRLKTVSLVSSRRPAPARHRGRRDGSRRDERMRPLHRLPPRQACPAASGGAAQAMLPGRLLNVSTTPARSRRARLNPPAIRGASTARGWRGSESPGRADAAAASAAASQLSTASPTRAQVCPRRASISARLSVVPAGGAPGAQAAFLARRWRRRRFGGGERVIGWLLPVAGGRAAGGGGRPVVPRMPRRRQRRMAVPGVAGQRLAR